MKFYLNKFNELKEIEKMKSLILLTIFLATTLSLRAQSQNPNIKAALTAGEELIKANNHFTTGIIFTLAGVGISIVPALSETDSSEIKYYHIAGGCISLFGAILLVESFSHIGKAGRLMNQNKTSLLINENGIGLRHALGKK